MTQSTYYFSPEYCKLSLLPDLGPREHKSVLDPGPGWGSELSPSLYHSCHSYYSLLSRSLQHSHFNLSIYLSIYLSLSLSRTQSSSALNTATKSGPCCAVFFRMMHQKNNGLSKNTEYMTTIATAGSTVPQAGHLQAAQKPTKTTKSQKSNRKPKPPKAKSHQKPRATESEPAFLPSFLPSFLPGFVSFLFF